MLDASVDQEATDELLRRELTYIHRMPLVFRALAHDLLHALTRYPAASRIVGRVLIDFAKASLERQGDRAKVH